MVKPWRLCFVPVVSKHALLALCLSAILAVCGDTLAQRVQLEGTFASRQGKLHVSVVLKDGRPALVDLAFTPHQFRIAQPPQRVEDGTHEGVPGKFRYVPRNLTALSDPHIRLSRWIPRRDGRHATTLRLAGTETYTDDGTEVWFSPENGAESLVRVDPPATRSTPYALTRSLPVWISPLPRGGMYIDIQEGMQPGFETLEIALRPDGTKRWKCFIRTAFYVPGRSDGAYLLSPITPNYHGRLRSVGR
jgi:hypothetical protein